MKRFMMLLLISVLTLNLVACAKPSTASDKESSPPSTEGSKAEQTDSSADPGAIPPMDIKIYAGSVGASWTAASAAIGQLLPQLYPDVTTTVVPGLAMSNVIAVQNGEAQLAFSKTASTVDGIEGVEPFTEKTDKVCNIAYLNEDFTHVITLASSNINSWEDLKDKRLSVLQYGSTGEQMARFAIEASGLTYDDFSKVSQNQVADSVEMMKDGQVDAWILCTPIPSSLIIDLANSRDIKFLSITPEQVEEISKRNSAYFPNVIPNGTYDAQTEDISSFGVATHLIVNADMDEEIVYELTKSIVENREILGDANASFAGLTPEDMAKDIGVPMHPGAERYYREIGVLN